MKRKVGVLLASVASAVLCVSVVALASVSDVSVKTEGRFQRVSEQEPQVGGTKVPTYRCQECNAPHGGCYYPLCPDCHSKQCPPKPFVPPTPINPK